jgi:hypothetical protein
MSTEYSLHQSISLVNVIISYLFVQRSPCARRVQSHVAGNAADHP